MNVLLTGAGFTKNYGGLLAGEVWNEIFNHPQARLHPNLLQELSDSYPDFEAVYDLALNGKLGPEAKDAAISAVGAAFRSLDKRIVQTCQGRSLHGVRSFLGLFGPSKAGTAGFVFTLNQDLFVERFALQASVSANLTLPGYPFRPGCHGPYLAAGSSGPLASDDYRVVPTENDAGKIEKSTLIGSGTHYVKLHGSMAWRRPDGGAAMVIGRGKGNQIAIEPILLAYFRIFQRVLLERASRIVIVGYSFRDDHINDLVADAVAKASVDLVVVNPAPWSVFRQRLTGSHKGGALAAKLTTGRGSRYFCASLTDLLPEGGKQPEGWAQLLEALG